MLWFLARLFKYIYPLYCFYCYYSACDNFIDPITDFSQNKLAVFFAISFLLYYYQKFVKKILQVLLGCTLDEEKSLSDVIFLMLEFCITKNSNFIYDIYLPSKIISFSGSIITAIDELIDGFSVKIVLPSIATHVTLMLFLFLFFGIHFYFLCYFLINYKKNIEVNSLIFNNIFTILYYTIGAAIYHALFIFDRSNFGCSIQTEHKANMIRNYGGLIYHILDFFINVIRITIIGPSLYTSFHIFLSFGKLYNSFDDFTFYLKVKNIKSELPDATAEDIERDDTCIICREAMTVGTAKKLPCGHCFHTTCLERWVNKSPACPTCSCDLRKILKKSNNGQGDQKNDEQDGENGENDIHNENNDDEEANNDADNRNDEDAHNGTHNENDAEDALDDIHNKNDDEDANNDADNRKIDDDEDAHNGTDNENDAEGVLNDIHNENGDAEDARNDADNRNDDAEDVHNGTDNENGIPSDAISDGCYSDHVNDTANNENKDGK